MTLGQMGQGKRRKTWAAGKAMGIEVSSTGQEQAYHRPRNMHQAASQTSHVEQGLNILQTCSVVNAILMWVAHLALSYAVYFPDT